MGHPGCWGTFCTLRLLPGGGPAVPGPLGRELGPFLILSSHLHSTCAPVLCFPVRGCTPQGVGEDVTLILGGAEFPQDWRGVQAPF